MGSEWRPTTVGSFCPFTYGKGLPKKKRNANGNIKVYGSNGPVGVHNKSLVDAPGIVIGRKGTVGAVHFSPDPFWPIDTTFYIVGANNRDLRFTYYLLKSLGLEHMNADSAVPGLNRDAAHARRIRVPPLPEQRAVAHILGTLDDKIELNRRMNETLEETARTIFKSWFVDFDPVRAKAEGRDTGLPKEVAALFPDSFEDSELGEIPKGWKVKMLSNVAEVVDCLHSKKPQVYPGSNHLLLQVYNVGQTGRLDLTKPYPISKEDYKKWTSRIEASGGDVVITKTGRVGAVAQIPQGMSVALGRNMVAIRAKDGLSAQRFLKDSLLSGHMRREIEAKTNDGTILRSLHVKNINKLRLVLPPFLIIKKYEILINSLHEQTENNDEQSRTLTSIRDTLLPKLISGEIRVKDAEKVVEANL